MESFLSFRMKTVLSMAELYVCVLLLAVLVHGACASSFCQQVVEPLGYGCREFTVKTEDGFVLAMHRLSRISSLVASGGRASAPSVSVSPAFAPAVLQSGQGVSQYPEGHGQAPSAMVTPSGRSSLVSVNESTMLTVPSSVAAHSTSAAKQAPAVLGNRSTDVHHHSDSANSSNRRRRQHHPSQGSSPGQPEALLPSNRTAGATSPTLSIVAPGPAPTRTTQSPSPSSGRKQRQSSTGGGSRSNYTANPEAGKGSPVLLMHQEFLNGDTWFEFVDLENRSSSLLPIMLLNDGFDVWIGHQRATYWSRGHTHLKSTDREYWNWSWDQHAQYDLPAQVLYISTETNQPVHFIGLSQAATVGVAAATDHETAQMIRSLTLIGPTAYRGYTNSLVLDAWAYIFGYAIDSEYYATGFQNGAFNYSTEFPQTGSGVGNTAISVISGPNCCLSSAPMQFVNGWDGTTSFKNLLHWQQGIRTNNFAHYDHGSSARNMQAYGRTTPPAYNVGLIPRRMPVLIVAGGRDWFAPSQGIRLLLSQLQQQATLINMTNYAHYDLEFSVRREVDVYLPVLQYLEGPKFQ
ncbi:hypothetical protein KC19_10G060900 [Ceratodon purpureus]|uniref:AB hydrolase-1 domain-containing protein n=1 Tax=Ceratodon purpureus TaxID=3225 RepID=A0A8T0GKW7_CERPU|nr:hypothetical protein KC19_10G060900 [Ceratodon purpureus]